MKFEIKASKKYKIAFDARPAQGEGTGVATYSTNIIKEMNNLSDKFDFVFILDTKLKHTHIDFPRNSQFISTAVGRNSWFLRDIWMQIILPKRLEKLGVNLFHQPDYIIPIRPVKFLLVSSFLDAIAFTPVDNRNFLSKIRLKYLIRRGSKNADAIVTISNYSKDELLKHLDINSSKIFTIWCNISEKYFHSYTDDIANKCLEKLNNNGKYILYFGGFGKRKNVELLLDAYKLIVQKTNIKLVIAGKTTVDIEQKIKTLLLEEKVELFGFAKVEELIVLLDKCEIFVFPSLMEGFGLPVAEALAVGAPVVCSKNGSLPEIAGEAAHFFKGSDPLKLADAILDVLNNSTLRDVLKAKGPKRAKMFDGNQSTEKLSKLYINLIENKLTDL